MGWAQPADPRTDALSDATMSAQMTEHERPGLLGTLYVVLTAMPWWLAYAWAAYAWLPFCGWLMGRPWVPFALAIVAVLWWRLF